MLGQKVLLLDTGIGNIQSVANVLEYIGASFEISSDPALVNKAEKIIFPGVGAYGVASKNLEEKNLYLPLRKALIDRKVPCLGICLGMQILAEFGEEFGEHRGLGVIPGVVRRIENLNQALRLPHVGWNSVKIRSGSRLFKSIPEESNFYFLHSYYFDTTEKDHVSAHVDYGKSIAAAVEKENIFGVQFHPEKSQEFGIQLFRNFLEF